MTLVHRKIKIPRLSYRLFQTKNSPRFKEKPKSIIKNKKKKFIELYSPGVVSFSRKKSRLDLLKDWDPNNSTNTPSKSSILSFIPQSSVSYSNLSPLNLEPVLYIEDFPLEKHQLFNQLKVTHSILGRMSFLALQNIPNPLIELISFLQSLVECELILTKQHQTSYLERKKLLKNSSLHFCSFDFSTVDTPVYGREGLGTEKNLFELVDCLFHTLLVKGQPFHFADDQIASEEIQTGCREFVNALKTLLGPNPTPKPILKKKNLKGSICSPKSNNSDKVNHRVTLSLPDDHDISHNLTESHKSSVVSSPFTSMIRKSLLLLINQFETVFQPFHHIIIERNPLFHRLTEMISTLCRFYLKMIYTVPENPEEESFLFFYDQAATLVHQMPDIENLVTKRKISQSQRNAIINYYENQDNLLEFYFNNIDDKILLGNISSSPESPLTPLPSSPLSSTSQLLSISSDSLTTPAPNHNYKYVQRLTVCWRRLRRVLSLIEQMKLPHSNSLSSFLAFKNFETFLNETLQIRMKISNILKKKFNILPIFDE